MYPVHGASGGAILSPLDKIPTKLVIRDPCHRSILLESFSCGRKRSVSPSLLQLNTYIGHNYIGHNYIGHNSLTVEHLVNNNNKNK